MEIRLSAFADEASADLLQQIETLNRERIPLIELRGVNGKNVAEFADEEAVRYREQLDAGGIEVWAIGSPLGKIGAREEFDRHLKKAEHIFRLANIFGTSRVRVFSFYTNAPERDEAEVFARLRAMSELAKDYGVTLFHENEKGIYGDLPVRNLKLLKNVAGLRCVFDPANYVQCGADIEKALDLLEDKIDYYHIKDALYAGGEVVPAGKGEGRLSRMIGGICKDTVLTLEPHLTVFDGYAKIDCTQLRHKYHYNSSKEAFAAAAQALRELLRENCYMETNEVWKK